jgi:hypothetical protein
MNDSTTQACSQEDILQLHLDTRVWSCLRSASNAGGAEFHARLGQSGVFLVDTNQSNTLLLWGGQIQLGGDTGSGLHEVDSVFKYVLVFITYFAQVFIACFAQASILGMLACDTRVCHWSHTERCETCIPLHSQTVCGFRNAELHNSDSDKCRFRLEGSSWEVANSGQPIPHLHATITVAQNGQAFLTGGYSTVNPVNSPYQEVISASGEVWALDKLRCAHDTN